MSKYTTELRFICETYAGYSESQGYDKVADIIQAARPYIFEDYTLFDPEYKAVLETKILRHYYTREIGLETVGLWKLHFNNRLQEILPYYNKLYESAALQFNPMHDVDYTISHQGQGTSEDSRSGTDSETNGNTRTLNTTRSDADYYSGNTSTNSKTKTTDKFSDTPQGAITNLEDGTYLTNARISVNEGLAADNIVEETGNDTRTISDTGTIGDSGSRSGTHSTTGSGTTTEAYIRTISGKMGVNSYSKLLSEYRKTLINIDEQVIREFKDLFFLLW